MPARIAFSIQSALLVLVGQSRLRMMKMDSHCYIGKTFKGLMREAVMATCELLQWNALIWTSLGQYVFILGIRMCIRCLTQSTWKVRMVKLEALAKRRCAVLRLSVHESASEVNRSDGDTQVISHHHYLVVFHAFVE